MKHGYGFIRCKKCKGFTLATWHGREYVQPCKQCGRPMIVSRQRIQQFKELKPKKTEGK